MSDSVSAGTYQEFRLDEVHTNKIREGIEGIFNDAVNTVFKSINKSMDSVVGGVAVNSELLTSMGSCVPL